MGAVLVHLNALDLFGVDVAGNVIPLVNDNASLAGLFGLVGKHRAVQAGAYNQIIHHDGFLLFRLRFCTQAAKAVIHLVA